MDDRSEGKTSAPTEGSPPVSRRASGRTAFSPSQEIGGRYRVVGLLGRGGMGEVWQAYDLKLGLEVALKTLLGSAARHRRRLELLRQEVRAAREVVSPNVCRIFDLVEVAGIELVSMEYVDGRTLLDELKDRAPLDVKDAQEIASQFLAGLEAIHDARLVHRDVKPENIMLTRAGRVVVMDFGLARRLDAGDAAIAGTPPYMAPEQLAGHRVDARADVYSAGVVLAEMVCPDGISGVESRRRLWDGIRAEPVCIADTPWAPVIAKAVASLPEDRYSSARSLTRALEEVTLRVRGAEDLRPYPGLESFAETDAEYFFGREAEVEQMWRRLEGPSRMLAIVGPSGAGKTSFIRAGMLPSAPAGWGILRCTPADSPMASLRRAVFTEVDDDPANGEGFEDATETSTLSACSRWREGHHRAVIVVDQLEELFTMSSLEVRDRFANLLRRLVLDADIFVLLSLRDDFLMECCALDALKPISSSLTLLDLPTGGSLRRALVQPAARCGYRFEDEDLVDEMLAEVQGERAALPMLAFAASSLWERRDTEAGQLTRSAYQAIGRVEGALARHAEAMLATIGRNQLPIVRALMRELVTAQGTRAARDRTSLLSVVDEDRRPSAEEALDSLIDARLLTSYEVHGTLTETERSHLIEIVHESLITHWPRLVRWRTQDADAVQIRDQVRQAARMWDERGQPTDLLWTGTSFKEYELWQERHDVGLSETERRFTKAMVARATRLKRRRRLALASALLVTSSLAVAAGIGWRIARLERDRASLEIETLEATGNFLIDLFRAEEADELTARDILTRAGDRIAAQQDIPLVQARMMHTIGRFHINLGDYERGAEMLEKSLRIKHEHLGDDHPTIALSLQHLGKLFQETAQLRASESMLQRSLAMSRRLGDDGQAGYTAGQLGWLYYESKRFDEARPLFEEALRIAADGGRPLDHITALNQMASIQMESNEYRTAAQDFNAAIEIARDILQSDHVVSLLEGNLGALGVRRGDHREGISQLLLALEAMEASTPDENLRRRLTGMFLMEVGRGYLGLRQWGEAARELRQAIALLDHSDNSPRSRSYAAEGYAMLAQSLIEQGDIEAATEIIERGRTSLEQVLPSDHPSRVMLAVFSIETPGDINL